jgi:hypothetical protein
MRDFSFDRSAATSGILCSTIRRDQEEGWKGKFQKEL